MPCHDRHGPAPRSAPSITRYGREAYEGYQETPLYVDKEDEGRLEALEQRVKQVGVGALDQARELWDDILARKEERKDTRSRPWQGKWKVTSSTSTYLPSRRHYLSPASGSVSRDPASTSPRILGHSKLPAKKDVSMR